MFIEDLPLPPCLTLHGDMDTVVPYSISARLREVLALRRQREVGMHGGGSRALPLDVFLPVRGAHHAFNLLFSPRTLACGDALVDCMNEWRRRELLRRRAKSL
jgi:hypothetical protein